MIDDLNHRHDVRLVLDDTLYYDSSEVKLACTNTKEIGKDKWQNIYLWLLLLSFLQVVLGRNATIIEKLNLFL